MSASKFIGSIANRSRDDRRISIESTPSEIETRTDAVLQMIAAVNEVQDQADEDDRDFFQTIDSTRPERPLFEGLS